MSSSDAPQEETSDSGLKAFVTGGFGGMCLVAAGHPLDLIKVRLQTMKVEPGVEPPYTGMVDCAKKIIKADGVTGLYKGMSAPLTGVSPIFAICFWGYECGKDIQRAAFSMKPDEPLSSNQIMFAGGFSAIPTTLVMAPGERIKCLLQIDGMDVEKGGKPKYAGMADCAKKVWGEGGISSLYRGWEATLLRDIPGSVAYFGGFEAIKAAMTPEGGDPADLNPVATFCAGGMAGVFNWLIAIPPDTLKSRYQTAPPGKYSGLRDVFREVMAEGGVGAMYRGVAPAMARAFPANAACFLGVGVAKKVWDSVLPGW